MTTPYTYRVTHIPTGTWYYGVRYARGCSPKDLFVSYYTSSKKIKTLIKQEGTVTFVTEIRKIFYTPEEAISWELRVLQRTLGWPTCINENAFPAVVPEARARGNAKKAQVQPSGLTIFQQAGKKWKERQHLVDPVLGMTLKEVRKQRYNESLDRNGTRYRKTKLYGDLNPSKRPEVRAKIQATLRAKVEAGTFPTTKGRKFPNISEKLKGNKSVTGMIWYNDGHKDYRLNANDARIEGLKEGRLFSAIRGKRYQVIRCPHCGKEGSGGNMKRYHFDACRL